MNFGSSYAYISQKMAPKQQQPLADKLEEEDLNLNVFIVTFQGVKNAEKELAGGDPYHCKECKSILNKYSKVYWHDNLEEAKLQNKLQLGINQAFWKCQFCDHENILKIQKQEIPSKDDVVYMLESNQDNLKSQEDSTLVFCIDASGSMNSTSEIEGKVELKYGLSLEEIEMLKQFMEPGDEAQFNFLPGANNHNKTFISRKQCILSAIQSQLNELKKTDPNKKIGFVIFNNEVMVVGDSKSQNVHIVGDKLYEKQAIINSLAHFKLNDSIIDSFDNLLKNINKTQAKGQTALGPALVTALDLASKGSPGSSVILCTDGLANIGIGQLQPYDQQRKQFYIDLAESAKSKNISVSIITIKGQGCKIEAIGKLAEITNGNIKVVNPEKLSDDFANVLKDQVVGLNVIIKILLHKSMMFRNQSELKSEDRILEKTIANATKNTRVSFEYEVKNQQELNKLKIDIKQLKKIPFQAQIEYTSTTGVKFLRVISSQCDTTTEKEQMKKKANLGVVHQRITSQTAQLYKAGNFKDSTRFNNRWANYLNHNFKQHKYQEYQEQFNSNNERLNRAIRHRHRKSIQKKQALNESLSEEENEIINRLSDIESDEDQKELVDNLMERQNYSITKRRLHSNSGSDEEKQGSKKVRKESIKKERKKSLIREEKEEKKERRKSIPKRKQSYNSGSDSN